MKPISSKRKDTFVDKCAEYFIIAYELANVAATIDGNNDRLQNFWKRLNLLTSAFGPNSDYNLQLKKILPFDDFQELESWWPVLESAKRLPPWRNQQKVIEALQWVSRFLKAAEERGTQMARKARVFIGSSVEGLNVAKKLQEGLDYSAECTLWSQGVFGLSGSTIENLITATAKFDFAILVLTPDDLTTKRELTRGSPRDNVIFELGLFIGALGRARVYIVCCREDDIDLPSDLAGVTMAKYGRRQDNNLRAALGIVCSQIEDAIKEIHADSTS